MARHRDRSQEKEIDPQYQIAWTTRKKLEAPKKMGAWHEQLNLSDHISFWPYKHNEGQEDMNHLPETGFVRLTQTINDPTNSTEKNLQTTENKTVPVSPETGRKSAKQEVNLDNETVHMNGRILAPSTLRVRRYRQRHPRFDYYPAPDVLAIIKHHQAVGNEPCIAGIIDGLIRAGHSYISENIRRKS